MNEQPNETNPNAEINDLAANRSDEVKGGMLKRIRIGGMSVAETAAALPDLEPQGEIKGGPGGWGTNGGVLLNHNETTASDAEDAELDDLLISAEQEEEINGGAPGRIIIGYGGEPNHNETTVEDEAEAEALDDLPVEDDEQVKGGPGGWGSSGVLLNHNETTAADEAEDEAETATLDDLPLPKLNEAERASAEEIKGGWFKPGKELAV